MCPGRGLGALPGARGGGAPVSAPARWGRGSLPGAGPRRGWGLSARAPVSAPARWGRGSLLGVGPLGGGAPVSAPARWGRGSLPGAGPRGAGSRGGGARKSRLHSGSAPGTGGREGPPERCDGVHRGVIPFGGPQDDLCDPLHFLNKEFSKTKKPRQEVPSQKPGPKGRKVMHALRWAALLAPSPQRPEPRWAPRRSP